MTCASRWNSPKSESDLKRTVVTENEMRIAPVGEGRLIPLRVGVRAPGVFSCFFLFFVSSSSPVVGNIVTGFALAREERTKGRRAKTQVVVHTALASERRVPFERERPHLSNLRSRARARANLRSLRTRPAEWSFSSPVEGRASSKGRASTERAVLGSRSSGPTTFCSATPNSRAHPERTTLFLSTPGRASLSREDTLDPTRMYRLRIRPFDVWERV